MTAFDKHNNGGKPLEKFDLIYNSDISKWIRFANSLKLRLAMRVRSVYPEAQKIAEAAVNHEYGVIEGNSDNPVMQSNVALAYTYFKDRKSTRLNSSHANISYAVFCLKK